MDGKLQTGGAKEQPDAQKKVYQMGNEKTDEIARHTPSWQKQIEKKYIKKGCYNIVLDADMLLSQSFCNGIGDGITVEHGDQ